MYRDSFIPYHDSPGTKIGRPCVNKVYMDYRKAKSKFYMKENFLCIVVIELVVLSKLKNWYFGGAMLSHDLIFSHSQVIDQGPSALLFLYQLSYRRLITEVIGMAFFCQSIRQSVSPPVHWISPEAYEWSHQTTLKCFSQWGDVQSPWLSSPDSRSRLQLKTTRFTLEFHDRPIYLEAFQYFHWTSSKRRCAEFMTLLRRLKVTVTLQYHVLAPLIRVFSISPDSMIAIH